jgi:4-diphosphocytidyl-2-C-methyl-D-erythritol kinase
MHLLAPAKINLFLRSINRRADGYHELETVFVHCDLADTIWLEARVQTITVDSALDLSPSDDLAGRAAQALRRAAGRTELGVHIRIDKRIPVGGGLGGGSSNAAAVLRGLNELWSLHFEDDRLLAIAAELGADVPFLLRGGLALARGVGEQLEAIPCALKALDGVLLFPKVGVSTPRAFGWLDDEGKDRDPRSAETLLKALAQGDAAAVVAHCYNGFAAPVAHRVPEVAQALDEARRAGFVPLLCGSGSTVLALTEPGAPPKASLLERWSPTPVRLSGLQEEL